MSDLVADALQVGATRRVAVLVGDALRKPDAAGGTGQVVIQVDPELVAMHPGPRFSPVLSDLLDGATAYTSGLGTSASDPPHHDSKPRENGADAEKCRERARTADAVGRGSSVRTPVPVVTPEVALSAWAAPGLLSESAG
ncbi:hypothetical protein OHT20_22820 [Streptomyces caniferus]|uniref:Uncharacterized protein n=1 Tax=Streptomyces caniferus TaxID=285557 RepID=A0A640SGY8_9ACTN|nr:hypothetical protein [Streptomyces caniferus]GFE10517.1 hypothetical protein Scani_67850 [Streptomyces caniferus]